MSTKWIVIINRVEARVFDAEGMLRINVLQNAAGREKNRAFTTDKPFTGRSSGLSKSLTHSVGESSPHDEVAKRFAKKIGNYLKKRFDEHLFESVVLVAEPRMHGWVNSALDDQLKKLATWESGDLGKLSDHELKIHFLGKESAWPRVASSQFDS